MRRIIKRGKRVPGQDFWEILLNKWFEIMDEYVLKSEDDLPYWHSERANTGFLAAAAWKIGALAIEEYFTKRVYSSKRYDGQCDLWIKYKNFEFSAEAKQLWRKEYDKESIGQKFRASAEQLDSIQNRRKSEDSFCICYLSLMTKESPDLTTFAARIEKDFAKDEDIIIALYSPSVSSERMVWKESNQQFPCIVLFLKSIKTRSL